MCPVPSTPIVFTTIDNAGLHASAFRGLVCTLTVWHTQILRRVAGRRAPVASLRIVLSSIITLHVVGWYALLKLHCAELVFYVCKCVVRVVAPWRFDVRFGAPQRPCEGADGGGGRVRHPATPLAARAVARAVAARSVCARPPKGLCEGTLRRDLSKGQAWTFRRDFRRDFSQGLHIYTTAKGLGFSNRFQPFKSPKVGTSVSRRAL